MNQVTMWYDPTSDNIVASTRISFEPLNADSLVLLRTPIFAADYMSFNLDVVPMSALREWTYLGDL